MTARSAAELITARQLAAGYLSMANSVSKDALLARVAGRTLHAAIYRQYAVIARRAALAEELDPDEADPRDRECGICGRVVCVARCG